jgi:hypothetical protein
METLAMIRQAFWEEIMVRTRKFYTLRHRKAKRKIKSILIIFFDIKEIVHKEFVLAGQTVNFRILL